MRLLWLNLLRCIGMLTLLRRWLFSIDLLDTPKCGVDILNVFNGLVKVKKKMSKVGAVKTRGAITPLRVYKQVGSSLSRQR